MTVFDSSAIVDLLLGLEAAGRVEELLASDIEGAAPEVLTFEVLAVLRRAVLRGALSPERASAALDDLGDVQLELFAAMPLRRRAWELRDNLPAADALFVALAELLDEPLATKDRRLASATRALVDIDVIEL